MKTKFLLFALLCASQCHSMPRKSAYRPVEKVKGFDATDSHVLVPPTINDLIGFLVDDLDTNGPIPDADLDKAIGLVQKEFANIIVSTLKNNGYNNEQAKKEGLKLNDFVLDHIVNSTLPSAAEFEEKGFPKNIASKLHNEFIDSVILIKRSGRNENSSNA